MHAFLLNAKYSLQSAYTCTKFDPVITVCGLSEQSCKASLCGMQSMITTSSVSAGFANWQGFKAHPPTSTAMQSEPSNMHNNAAYEASGAVRASRQAVSPTSICSLDYKAGLAGESLLLHYV